MNWADSKNSVNSGKPSPNMPEGNPEPSQCSTHEGVETGHGGLIKACKICGKPKSEKDFYKKDRNGRRDGTCKSCRIITQREKTLGITNDEYWDLYYKQGGRCGICRRRIYSKRYKRFNVDHNHETGEIRGLLCHNCNRAIGMLQDDPTVIGRAVDWVKGQSDTLSNGSKQ